MPLPAKSYILPQGSSVSQGDDGKVIWKCVYCLNPEDQCMCESAEFIKESGSVKTADSDTLLPTCPDCNDDRPIYCVECGNHSPECTCLDSNDWFCMGCQEMFHWSLYEPMIGDDDEKEEEAKFNTLLATDGTEFIFREGQLFWKEDGRELKCACLTPKKFACATCKVRRDNEEKLWGYWDLTKSPNDPTVYRSPTAKTTPPVPKSMQNSKSKWVKTAWSDWDDEDEAFWASNGSYKICRHYDREVKLKDHSVWASSMNDGLDRKTPPDFGLYADWGWQPYWRNEHIDWPDFKSPRHPQIGAEAIIEAYERILDGKRVEVGCIGGHGRTGTIIACLALLDGIEVDKVIDFVRNTYCQQAIESKEQEWYINWFDAIINGKTPPDKPVIVTTTTVTTQGGVSTTINQCTMREHYYDWTDGLTECPERGDKCTFWKKDVAGFEEGKVTYHGEPEARRKVKTYPAPVASESVQPWHDIDGFKVPKPDRGSAHHDPARPKGCRCDYCRYTALTPRGVGVAFLDPVDPEKSLYLNVSGPNGEIIRVPVPEKEPKSPAHALGKASTEYEWDDKLGWQWKGQKSKHKKSKKKKSKRVNA